MCHKLITFTFICCTLGAFIQAASYEYGLSWCDPDLCPPGHQHVACNHNGEFQPNCPDDAVVIDLKPYRSMILHEHNKRRNFIALGKLPGYYPASRMATMVWDEELAYLAALNLKMCYVEHDECNNSHRFPNAGQNLSGIGKLREATVNATELIVESMGFWFGEYHVVDSDLISNFHIKSNFEEYGHFAAFVLDRNTHVGCAMVRYTRPDYPNFYIYNTACNYASNYALGVPVYRAGMPTSECKTGPNLLYPGLCSVKEKYNPSYW